MTHTTVLGPETHLKVLVMGWISVTHRAGENRIFQEYDGRTTRLD